MLKIISDKRYKLQHFKVLKYKNAEKKEKRDKEVMVKLHKQKDRF